MVAFKRIRHACARSHVTHSIYFSTKLAVKSRKLGQTPLIYVRLSLLKYYYICYNNIYIYYIISLKYDYARVHI